MANRLLCVLIATVLIQPIVSDTKPQHQQPGRPTRTLGSLFGSSKPTPVPVPLNQPVVQQDPKFSNSLVRPLVYQVKYYDRVTGAGVNNNLVDNLDARNYGNIDKAGVVVDGGQHPGVVYNQQLAQQYPQQYLQQYPQQQYPQQHQFTPQYPQQYPNQYPQQQYPPRVFYYNPLIPQQVDTTPVQPQVYYTIAQVGNTQVLVPCSAPPDQVYDSTVALNVDHPVQQSVIPVPVQKIPLKHEQMTTAQATASVVSHQQRVVVPPSTVTQPLVREQVVAAAAELNALGGVPGSGVVGAGLNTAPYGYYYYYYIPNNDQVVQQQRLQGVPTSVQPQVQYIPPYNYRYNNQVVPLLVSGVPGLNYHHQVVPQVLPHQAVKLDGNKTVSGGQRVVSGVKHEVH